MSDIDNITDTTPDTRPTTSLEARPDNNLDASPSAGSDATPDTIPDSTSANTDEQKQQRLPNVFWADGSYTNLFGKTKQGKPAACPDEVRDIALENLEAARAAGRAPRPTA